MAQKNKGEPKGDRNRIVIEGIDEPKKVKRAHPSVRGQDRTGRQVDVDRELFPLYPQRPKKRYSDRMRISPFKQGYYGRKGYQPGTRSRRLKTRT